MSDWQAIKYRVIGAGVIVVSLGLAWWLLLDHEVHRLQGDNTDFPQPFEVEKFDIEEPAVPAGMNSEGSMVDSQPVTSGVIERTPEAGVPAAPPEPAVQEPVAVVEPVEVTKPVVVKEPAVVKEPEVVKKPEVAKEPVSAKEPARDAAKVTVAPNGLPEAWVLQVGSFQEKAYAEELQKKLVAGKFPAYVKVFNLPAGKTYKVLVGPKLQKDRAAQMAKEIEKAHNLKSLIMQYRPGFEE